MAKKWSFLAIFGTFGSKKLLKIVAIPTLEKFWKFVQFLVNFSDLGEMVREADRGFFSDISLRQLFCRFFDFFFRNIAWSRWARKRALFRSIRDRQLLGCFWGRQTGPRANRDFCIKNRDLLILGPGPKLSNGAEISGARTEKKRVRNFCPIRQFGPIGRPCKETWHLPFMPDWGAFWNEIWYTFAKLHIIPYIPDWVTYCNEKYDTFAKLHENSKIRKNHRLSLKIFILILLTFTPGFLFLLSEKFVVLDPATPRKKNSFFGHFEKQVDIRENCKVTSKKTKFFMHITQFTFFIYFLIYFYYSFTYFFFYITYFNFISSFFIFFQFFSHIFLFFIFSYFSIYFFIHLPIFIFSSHSYFPLHHLI